MISGVPTNQSSFTETPRCFATASVIAVSRCSMRLTTSSLNARAVPVSVTVSGITLKASPSSMLVLISNCSFTGISCSISRTIRL